MLFNLKGIRKEHVCRHIIPTFILERKVETIINSYKYELATHIVNCIDSFIIITSSVVCVCFLKKVRSFKNNITMFFICILSFS